MDSLKNNTEIIRNGSAYLFSWMDYILFIAMLVLSTLIGIYFGFCKKQNTTDKYLLGGKKMGFIPVAISLIASHVSGITLLGVPSDVYYFGTAYMATNISAVIVGFLAIYVYLPVFYKLQIVNSFKYLEMRFDEKIRYITSFLFILRTVLYIPIVVYVPALAFSQVTGMNIHFITPVICFVCIFYTTIGGLKAVVWTDALQFVITLIAIFTVFTLGVIACGGIENIWQKSEEGGRLDFFNMDPSLTSRCTFFGVVIGLTMNWIEGFAISQGCIQKFLSIPKYDDVKRAMYIMIVGVCITKTVTALMGLIMFTKYQYCDPLSSEKIKRPDQILAYFVMDVTGHIKGLPGLFIAGVFCTALSTMSAALNTMSGTLYQDFIAPFIDEKTDEKRASNLMKLCAFLSGVICVLLVFVVEKLGGILQLGIAANSVTSGPMLGLFTLGLCFPWATAKGALVGSITSIVITVGMIFGAQYHKAQKNIVYPELPTSTVQCDSNFTFSSEFTNFTYPTTFDRSAHINDEVFFLFKLSYMYYALFSMLTLIIVALVVSWITGSQDLNKLNPELISPVMQFTLPKVKQGTITEKEKQSYKTVEQALELVKQNNNALTT